MLGPLRGLRYHTEESAAPDLVGWPGPVPPAGTAAPTRVAANQVARPRKRATGRQRIDPGRFRLPHDSKVDRRPHGSDAAKLTPDRHRGLLRALKDAPAVAVFAMATAATQRNGWTWAVGLDNFGFDYPLRALVAGPYLGGNDEKEAMYPLRYTDSTGGCSPARRPARCISSVPRRSTPSGR